MTAIIVQFIEYFTQILVGKRLQPDVVLKIARFMIFGTGMVAAKILSVGVQILMGRKLGPEMYGQITLITLLASYFAMPMVNGWGLAFVKISSRTEGKNIQLQAVKSLLLVFLLCGTATTILLLLLQNTLSTWLDVSSSMMQLSIIMTLFYAWWLLAKQIIQGFQQWGMYIAIENICAIVLFIGITFLLMQPDITLPAVIFVFLAGYLLSGLVVGKTLVYALFQTTNKGFTKDILSHGVVLLLNGLVGVATFSIDRIFINKALGSEEVGIYQAHFLATYGIMGAFMTILLTYIFPIFCRDDQHTIHNMISKWSKIQYPATIFFSLIIGIVVLRLYKYPISYPLFGCLCLFNAIQFHVQLKIWYIASKGVNASKITLKAQIIFLIVNVITLLLTIHQTGIIAGGISLLIASSMSLIYLLSNTQIFIHERTL